MVQAIQTIVSRNHYTLQDLVVSVTQIHTGSAENIIPDSSLYQRHDPQFRQGMCNRWSGRRLREIVEGQAASYGVQAELRIDEGYPATVNDPEKVTFAADVARDVAGESPVVTNRTREMGAEDFSYMLNERPGGLSVPGPGRGGGAAPSRVRFQRQRGRRWGPRSLPASSSGRNRWHDALLSIAHPPSPILKRAS